jgi:hypothetical protein
VLGKRAEVIVISMLICGIIGYAGLGLALAGTRIADAEHTVNTVVSHQNTLNATFRGINIQLTALGTSASFDGPAAITLVATSVADAELASRTVSHDEASLSAADSGLHAQPWLTVVSNGAVERTTNRIGHARAALAIAHSLAADQIQDGRFWLALYGSLSDLGDLNKQRDAGDGPAARQALANMSTDVNQASSLAGTPRLPAELAALTTDLKKVVADYTRQLDAEAAGHYDAAAAISFDVSADMSQVAGFKVEGIAEKLDAFYRPRIDQYNQEIAAATA